jgi:hypothetical protein
LAGGVIVIPLRLLGIALLIATGLVLLWWTWGKLGDARIDFPKELDVSWRITRGEAIYRDVDYLYGPLSPWINAGWFKLFGASIRTLVVCNAAILGIITTLLYAILRRFASEAATVMGCLSFLLLFGFGNFVGFSNYNYLTPYAHGLTHGMALLLAGLWAQLRWVDAMRARWLIVTGAVMGLCVLTKPEIAFSAVITYPACIMLAPAPLRHRLKSLCILACAGVLSFMLVFCMMLLNTPLPDAVRGTFGSYVHALDPQITQTKFYRFGLGTEHPLRSLSKVFVWCSYYARFLVPAALVGLLLARARRGLLRWSCVAGAGGICFAVIWMLRHEIRWEDAFRGLGLILGAILVTLAVTSARARTRTPSRNAALAFGILAATLLAKMVLNIRIFQYGFVLAMPCFLLVLIALVDWAPRLLNRVGADGRVLAGAAMGMLAAVIAIHLRVSAQIMRDKSYQLGSGADTIFAAGEEGRMLQATLEALRGRARAGATLAGLPEAAIFNYLLRLPNSTPFNQLTPISVRVFGEDRVTQAFVNHPPDWIVLVHQDTAVFGPRYLGEHYLQSLGHWIGREYTEDWGAGEPPLRSLHFGVSILRRRE